MLIVAVVRLVSWVARLLADRRLARRPAWPPELVDIDRRASVAMTLCTCGHIWHRHERPHVRTSCRACGCQRFRPSRQPGAGTPAPS